MASFLLVVASLFLLYIGSFYVTLFKNYLIARKTGLPLIIVPIHPNHLLWLIVSNPLRPLFKRYAPSFVYLRMVLSVYGWEYYEKRIVFRTLNTDSFMLVTCSKNEFYTINPEAVVDILKRPNDFDKPQLMKDIADMFGPSLFTSIGESWSRQRKLMTTIINERISRVVFDETWRQSRDMVADIQLESARSRHDEEAQHVESGSNNSEGDGFVYSDTFPSMKRIASNVLSRSAYGMPQEFKSTANPHNDHVKSSNIKLDMIECINTLVVAIILGALVPTWFLSGYPSFLPGARSMHRVGAAKNQFPGHVKKRLNNERKALKNPDLENSKSNLTSMLIKASEQGIDNLDGQPQNFSEKKQQQQFSLSEDELMGNLFIFTTAGFETTANALTYALVSLMAEPKWQDWIFEEIDTLFKQEEMKPKGDNERHDEPDYAIFYPKASRCLALMMEVLRLHPPLVHVARCTPEKSSMTIKTTQQTYHIPADCTIYIPFVSLHTDPKTWRGLNLPEAPGTSHSKPSAVIGETIEDVFAMTQDEYVFRPSRWINQTVEQMPDGSTSQTLFHPPKGMYAPFSGGPRICPGQKMAQVEFVCVILALFKDYKIEAVKQQGESDVELRNRMQGVLRDSHAEMTMVMERLHEVQVKFVKRRKI